MKILVTGGSGFIGASLSRYLSEKNYQIFLLLRSRENVPKQLLANNKITLIVTDIQYASIKVALQEAMPDIVIHLASLFLSSHNSNDLDSLVDSNITYGLYLLEAMDQLGIKKMINTGTSWEHYNDKEYEPVNLYAATKQSFEKIIDFYVDKKSIKAITLKLFDTYGPGDKRQKLISLLANTAISGEVIKMSPGEQELKLVHIDDVNSAYEKVIIDFDTLVSHGHKKYGVSSEQAYTLKKLVELISDAWAMSINIEWGGRPYREREVMKVWSTYECIPGWKEKVALITGLKQLKPKKSEV